MKTTDYIQRLEKMSKNLKSKLESLDPTDDYATDVVYEALVWGIQDINLFPVNERSTELLTAYQTFILTLRLNSEAIKAKVGNLYFDDY